MKKYDPEVIKRLSEKIGSTPKSIREQISRRALKHNVSEEAELANWARSEKISAASYIRKLAPDIKAQIYSRPAHPSNNSVSQPTSLRIIRIGKDEDKIYNQWWVQLFFAFFVVGITAGTIANIAGAFLISLLGIK